MALISSLVGLGEAAKDAHAQLGSLTEALPDLLKVSEAIKENVLDPLGELQKVLDTFQGPALGFKEAFEKIAKAVHDGTFDINEAREAISGSTITPIRRARGEPTVILNRLFAMTSAICTPSERRLSASEARPQPASPAWIVSRTWPRTTGS